jgi:hypothetical protein
LRLQKGGIKSASQNFDWGLDREKTGSFSPITEFLFDAAAARAKQATEKNRFVREGEFAGAEAQCHLLFGG